MLHRVILTLVLLFAFSCLSPTKPPAEASVPAPERLPPGNYVPKSIEVAGGEPSPIEIKGLTFYIFFCMNHEFEVNEEKYSWVYCHGYLTISPDEQYFCPFMILEERGVERFGMIEDPLSDPECRSFIPLIDPNSSLNIKSKIPSPQKRRPKPKSKPPGSGFALDQNGDSGETQTPL